MTPFITAAIEARTLGLALHYPFIHAAIVGMNATRTFEFGAGGSTRVILEAGVTRHFSVSAESMGEISDHYGISGLPSPSFVSWEHRPARSEATRDWPIDADPFDLILHDGSHAADVVAADVAWAWPRLKSFGLLLVHDTQHAYVGAEVREGLRRGLAGAHYSATTLPWGYGLTVVRCEERRTDEVVPARAKRTSPHPTGLTSFVLGSAR